MHGMRDGFRSTLSALFPSMAMARLVVFFAVHPGERFHLRALSRRTRIASASLQRELQRLVDMGALVRTEEQGRVYFSADEAHSAWRGWALLLRSSAAPEDVLREALVDAAGVTAAFVYGSTARGDARPESDIDVFLLLNDGAAAVPTRRTLSEAELLVGRPLDVVEYTPEVARERARSGNPFLKRVSIEPKAWLFGEPEAFAGVVTA